MELPWSKMTNDRLDISQARSGTLRDLVFKNKVHLYAHVDVLVVLFCVIDSA